MNEEEKMPTYGELYAENFRLEHNYRVVSEREAKLQHNWDELKKFVEEEKDRLVRECSQIYEDSLGKTRLVNEDIYNEVKNISDKIQELENGNNERCL